MWTSETLIKRYQEIVRTMPRYYSDPKAPNCPRAGWDFIIKDKYTENDKAKNTKNRGWRIEAEIDEIITAVLARNKYEAAKKKWRRQGKAPKSMTTLSALSWKPFVKSTSHSSKTSTKVTV